MHHKNSINIKWSLIWVVIHSISLFIIGFLRDYINIQNELIQLFLLGFGVTILARIAKIFTTKKRFIVDKWFLFWSLLNAFTIWIGYFSINLIGLTNPFWNVVIIAVLLVLIANIIRRFRLTNTRLIVLSMVMIAILFFGTNEQSGNYFNKIIAPDIENTANAEPNSTNYNDKISEIKENIKVKVDEISEELDSNSEKNIQKKEEKAKAESIEVFDYLNNLRSQKGLSKMVWDDRAYKMAVSRSKDMYERGYFSHLTPEGECMFTLKSEFGFKSNEIVAENLGGMTHYGNNEPIASTSIYEPLESWINSPGHNANLFYSKHTKGAIGCYKAICAFNGVHNDIYGLGAAPCSMYD